MLGRPHFAPQILLGFLLFLLGFGAILLVVRSFSERSAPTGVGELAVAVVLMILCARIWRTSEGARWMAGVFAVFFYPRTWLSMLPEQWHVSWLNAVHAFALIAIVVGLRRAQAWSRWAAGVASTLATLWAVSMLMDLYRRNQAGARAFVMCCALFWAAISVYLALPSTAALFAQVRADREPSDDLSI